MVFKTNNTNRFTNNEICLETGKPIYPFTSNFMIFSNRVLTDCNVEFVFVWLLMNFYVKN